MDAIPHAQSLKILHQENNIAAISTSEGRFISSFFGLITLLWLLISLLFLWVESIKLHAPFTFTEWTWTHFGKIHFVSMLTLFGALFHGLAWSSFSQIDIEGQYIKTIKNKIIGGFVFFNISLGIGIVEFFYGNTTEGAFLFPSKSLMLFFIATLILSSSLCRTFFEFKNITPALLFLIPPFVFLPFILITLILLMKGGFLQGAYGAWMGAWFTHQITALILIPLGLSTLLFLVEQLTHTPLKNRAPLYSSFWVYTTAAFFTSSDITRFTIPILPAWLRSLDTVGSLFSSFSVIIFIRSIYLHLLPFISTLKKRPSFPFFAYSVIALLILSLLKSITCFRTVEAWIQFTTFSLALQTLFTWGFLQMILLASFYEIIPRQLQHPWASPHLIRAHFWITSLATTFATLSLFSASAIQAYRSQIPEAPFLSTVLLIKPFLWVQSISLVFQFSGIIMTALLFILLQIQWKTNPHTTLFSKHA